MDFSSEKLKKLTKWIIGISATCIILFLGFQNINHVMQFVSKAFGLIQPLIIGLAIALIINVPMRFFERIIFLNAKKKQVKALRRTLSFLISVAMIFAIIIGVVFLILPELTHAITVLINTITDFITKLSNMSMEEIERMPFANIILKADWKSMLGSLQSFLENQGGNIVNTAFGTIGSLINGIFNAFISIIFAIYIIFSKETLKAQASRIIYAWMPNKAAYCTIHAFSVANLNFKNFVSGQFIEAIIIGVLCFAGMSILRLPFALMISVLIGVTALIPVVGAFTGAIIGAFLIMTVNPLESLVFIAFILILQQFEGNIIYPKVMGSKVNLPALWILASVTIGGGIAGAIGMLLSVPLAATVFVLFKEATYAREYEKFITMANPEPSSDSAADNKTDSDNNNSDSSEA